MIFIGTSNLIFLLTQTNPAHFHSFYLLLIIPHLIHPSSSSPPPHLSNIELNVVTNYLKYGNYDLQKTATAPPWLWLRWPPVWYQANLTVWSLSLPPARHLISCGRLQWRSFGVPSSPALLATRFHLHLATPPYWQLVARRISAAYQEMSHSTSHRPHPASK
jgi:hypothetical protein